jgi:predicted nuclease of predicted toxin-antitoxin system
MKFVADECVDGQIVARLRAEGHEVAYVAGFGLGAGDEAVLETANRTGALLLTADKDFGDLVFRLGRVAGGVVLVRLAGLREHEKAEVVATVVARHGEELRGAFTVVMPRGIRIRRTGQRETGLS